MGVCTSAGNHDQQRPEALRPLGLVSQLVSRLMWVLEADLQSSGRTVCAFNESHLSSTSIWLTRHQNTLKSQGALRLHKLRRGRISWGRGDGLHQWGANGWKLLLSHHLLQNFPDSLPTSDPKAGLERPRVQLVLVLCRAQAYPRCLLRQLGEGLRGRRIEVGGEGGSHE